MRIKQFQSNFLLSMLLGVLVMSLLGCQAMSSVSGTPFPTAGVALRGGVHGGNQPVTGASVYLYEASTSGYGAASTSLLCGAATTVTCATPGANVQTDADGNGYVVTDSNGGFNISGDYTCAGGAQIYLLALGGNPGLCGSVNNSSLALMAALGSCSTVASNSAVTFINVNEVTTISSVYPLAPFMTSETNVGTNGTNALGLMNAFGTVVYNLVNLATGTSPGVGQPVVGGPPAGLPANLTIPSAEIDTLANILSLCVNSDPSASTNCSTLFSDTAVNGVAPANTVQAALNIAQNPGLFDTTALFKLNVSTAPFQPVLNAAPQDFTLGLLYGGGVVNNALQNSYNSQAEYSILPIDVAQAMVLHYTYELPFNQNHKLMNGQSFTDALVNTLTDGWKISGAQRYQSGYPLPIVMSNNLGIGNYVMRPNIMPGIDPSTHKSIHGFNPLTDSLINAAAFITPPGYQFGNARPTYGDVRNFPVLNEDFTITKVSYLSRRVVWNLYLQAFNAFNRHRFTAFDTNFSDTTFGQATVPSQPRYVQIGTRFTY